MCQIGRDGRHLFIKFVEEALLGDKFRVFEIDRFRRFFSGLSLLSRPLSRTL